MTTNVVELRPSSPQGESGEVDTSLKHTAERSVVLTYKIAALAVRKITGKVLPFIETDAEVPTPNRHAELKPDFKFTTETEDGLEYMADVYGIEHMFKAEGYLSPLVVILPLTQKHDEGFQAPVIDEVQKYADSQGRAVIVMSSEGFTDKQLSARQLIDLNFEGMASNIHEVLDNLGERLSVEIPSVIFTGCSRGGTLSLLAATDLNQERAVEGVIAVAPAGLSPLDTLRKKFKTVKQFVVNEPFHIIRKASKLNQTDLEDYGRTLCESIAPLKARPAIGRTALLYMTDAPLEDIGQKLDEDTKVWVLTMHNDGVTMPKYWEQELGHLPEADVVTLPGHHVSIDSTTMVAGYIIRHLEMNQMAQVA